MKKFLLLIMVLVYADSMTATEFLCNSEVNAQWRSKTISVKGGGQTPDVVTLLKAFHQALPTWVVGEVLKQHAHPAKGTKRDGSTLLFEDNNDDEFQILIDPKNGYVGYSSMTDVDQMSACVWRRTNGHRIFAISLYEQHDSVQNLLCWYDYDPATQTMKAEKSPIDKYKKPFNENMEFSWTLPRKGTDFVIREYYNYLIPTVTRIYKWDGMEHKLAKTQIADFKYGWFGGEDLLQASKQGFHDYALYPFIKGESPVLCLRKKNDVGVDYILIVAPYKNNMQAVAAIDESTTIEGFFRVKPEKDAPWTGNEVIVFCRDFEHVNYYTVLNFGVVSYIVTDEPELDDAGNTIGYSTHINGYGSKKESIHIAHAEVAEHVAFNPKWEPLEFTTETRF